MVEETRKSAPTISVVIPVFNGERFIEDCLRSVRSACAFCDCEIICVNDGSTDSSLDILKRQVDISLIRNEKNFGFAPTCNRGMDEAGGEFILLLNQDTRCRSGAVEALLGRLRDDHEIAFIGPKFVGFDGQLQRACSGFPTPVNVLCRLTGLSRLFPGSRKMNSWSMSWFEHEREMYVDQPMGAALLFRRSLISEVGALDETFPIYFNDVDWSRRAVASGYKNLYYPDAVVEHFIGSATRPQKPRMIRESHRSLRRYLHKWFPQWRYAPLRFVDAALLWLSAQLRAVYWRFKGRG